MKKSVKLSFLLVPMRLEESEDVFFFLKKKTTKIRFEFKQSLNPFQSKGKNNYIQNCVLSGGGQTSPCNNNDRFL